MTAFFISFISCSLNDWGGLSVISQVACALINKKNNRVLFRDILS
ncbi:MAG: hypothetical protein RLZ76_1483 [Bacteroidota bacterium]|jgi:hypothetical protein